MITTEILFTRQEGQETINTCVLTLHHKVHLKTNEELLQALLAGISDYLENSPHGKKAWADTQCTFNITDLYHQNPQEVIPHLIPHGIHAYHLVFHQPKNSIPFDRNLSNI